MVFQPVSGDLFDCSESFKLKYVISYKVVESNRMRISFRTYPSYIVVYSCILDTQILLLIYF